MNSHLLPPSPPNWLKVVIISWLVLIPSNLFVIFGRRSAYVHGLLVDYLLPRLYLVEVASLVVGLGLVATAGLGARLTRLTRRVDPVLAGLTGLLIVRQLFSANPIASLTWLGLAVTALLVSWVLLRHAEIWHTGWMQVGVALSVVVQSVIGLGQFITQQSVAGYWLLGEPVLRSQPGLALGSLDGVERLLPYGTTPHPNVLAGFLAVALLVLSLGRKWRWPSSTREVLAASWRILAVGLGSVVLVLTQSIAAWLVVATGIGTWRLYRLATTTKTSSVKNKLRVNKPVVKGLLLAGLVVLVVAAPIVVSALAGAFPSATSLTRRAKLQTVAVTMLSRYPLTGVGLNTFTAELENSASGLELRRELVRFVQPVHNVGWLALSEGGVLTVVWLARGWQLLSPRSKSILVLTGLTLLPALSLDHYLLTLPAGQLTAVLLLSWWSSRNTPHLPQRGRLSN